jgi:hypothetical protein
MNFVPSISSLQYIARLPGKPPRFFRPDSRLERAWSIFAAAVFLLQLAEYLLHHEFRQTNSC